MPDDPLVFIPDDDEDMEFYRANPVPEPEDPATYACPDCGSIHPAPHRANCAALARASDAAEPIFEGEGLTVGHLKVWSVELDRLTFLWGWLEEHKPELAQQAEAEYAAHNRALGRVR